MHPDENRLEVRLQRAAETPADAPDLPAPDVEAYRRVYRAVRAAPLPEPPEDFARTMETLTRDLEEQAGVETGLLGLLGVLAPLGLLVAAAPALSLWAGRVGGPLAGLPWPLLGAIAAAGAAAWGIDRLARPLTGKPAPR